MSRTNRPEEELFAKIRSLSPDQVAVVEEFVDFLRERSSDRALVRAATQLSEPAFRTVWDNPDDAVYDKL